MYGKSEAVFGALRRMQQFLDDNPETLVLVNQSGARKELDDAVTRMAAHAVDQVAGRRTSEGETAKQASLRQTLRYDHMQPIAVIAGQRLREQPEFKLLRLPPWNVKGIALTTAARDMANAAEKYTDLFVQRGLAPDFVAQLRTAADQLDQSLGLRDQSQGQRTGATEGLRTETTKARAIIRLLESLVMPKLGTNDELIREWRFASHITRPRSTPDTTPQPGTSQPATPAGSPTPAPSTAAPVAAPAAPTQTAATAGGTV